MDAIESAADKAVGFLKPGKAKLVRFDHGPDADIDAILSPKPKDETELVFMFNPTQYKLQRSVKISRSDSPWDNGGSAEYLGTGPMILTMELFFDDFASARGDVTPQISKLLAWQMPDMDAEVPPPMVKFQWGNKQLDDFTGVITQLDINYTVFRRDGVPLQAKVNVTVEGALKYAEPGTNPTSHAVDTRRIHTMIEGETIASLAYAELGRPTYWRAIAELNEIDDPLRVKPGQALLIPSAADAARSA
jgi:hypothetical protein